MPRTRIRTVGAKLTEGEYAVVSAAAGGKNVGRWARDVILAAATTALPPADEVLLSEILALRTIVLNVQFSHVTGDRQTADSVQRLIDRADREKGHKAQERLLGVPRRTR